MRGADGDDRAGNQVVNYEHQTGAPSSPAVVSTVHKHSECKALCGSFEIRFVVDLIELS